MGSTRRLMSEWILSLEPERRRIDWPPTRYEDLGEQLEFCATLKLLASSVVRRRNVPPFSKVSKQCPRSSVLALGVPSRASCLCLVRPQRLLQLLRGTGKPHESGCVSGSGACSLVAYHSPSESQTPDLLDAHPRSGSAMDS